MDNINRLSGVTYFRLDTPYEGDTVKNCSLTNLEMDNNFYFLRGNDIESLELIDNKTLNLHKTNGEILSVTIDSSLEYVFAYDKDNGKLTISKPDSTVIQILEGFLTKNDLKIYNDNTLDGKGTLSEPMSVAHISNNGYYKMVDSFVDLTVNNELPEPCRNGYRFLAKENEMQLGKVFHNESLYAIKEKLALENSLWRIPTYSDLAELLNFAEISESAKTHDSDVFDVELGEIAGKRCKSTGTYDSDGYGVWKYFNDETVGENSLPYLSNLDTFNVVGNILPQDSNDFNGYKTSGIASLSGETVILREFSFNTNKVKQIKNTSNKNFSIRFVRDFNENSVKSYEYVLDNYLPTTLINGKVWTSVNFNDNNNLFSGSTVDDYNLNKKIIYTIYEWNGNSWDKIKINEGNCVTIKNTDDESYGTYVIYKDENGVLNKRNTHTYNKVNIINSANTYNQYPSAKAVYETIRNNEETIAAALYELKHTKVDSTTGKGLSSNDYTTKEKNKLTNIEEGATNVKESTVDEWGFTKNIGTVTGIKMNGTSKGTNGIIDLGVVVTEHQDITQKEDKSNKVTSWNNPVSDTNYPSEKLVKNSLDSKSDTGHTHDDRYYTESEIDDRLNNKSDKEHNHNNLYYTETEIDTKLLEKSNTEHIHDDRYYTESEIDIKLSGKSDSGHTHNNLYYTESEIDTKLLGKSDTGHTHNNLYYTEAETNDLLTKKSDTEHIHDDRYYTEGEIDEKLSLKANAEHNHNALYYTESEIDTKLSDKSDTAHTHNNLYYTESEIDEKLTGKSNTVHEHDDRYYTESEVDDKLSYKSNTTHTHDNRYYQQGIIDSKLVGKSDTGHMHDERYYTESEIDTKLSTKANNSHIHDDRYYTESEIDNILNDKSDTCHTHDNRYYIKSETDNKLNTKSDIYHNHDDRYFTETETTEKLNEKSNIGHIHDDRYYTESEIDNILNDKSDTCHTHDNRYYTKGETDNKLGTKSDIYHNHDNDYIKITSKGSANGVAELDENGKIPNSQLPGSVDNIVEGYYYDGKFYKDESHTQEIVPETKKIYVDKETNKTYRWSGSIYVEISSSLALGETSSTAYRGDRGKIAYDHSQSTHARSDATNVTSSTINGNIIINGTETTIYTHPGSGTNPHGTTKSDIGLGNVGNFKAVSTVASQDLTDTEKENARTNIDAAKLAHNHDDRYYTETEIDTKLSGKSDTEHTHDDRYYTETEIDNKLVNKEDNSNKVSGITSESTDAEYPSAKAVYTTANALLTEISGMKNIISGLTTEVNNLKSEIQNLRITIQNVMYDTIKGTDTQIKIDKLDDGTLKVGFSNNSIFDTNE